MRRVATFYHVTPSANRDSIHRHGLDWRHGGGGIAGSRAPEQEGIFLVEDMDETDWFVEMGAQRFAALDIWEITLEEDVLGDQLYEHPLAREFHGFLCWMQAIPPARLRLIKRDIPGGSQPAALG
jgi:hypothetical protein